MSALQEQAVQMIRGLSNEDVKLLIEIMRRWTRQGVEAAEEKGVSSGDKKWNAFLRLEEARKEIQQYLPKDFDPDKELEQARMERYGYGSAG